MATRGRPRKIPKIRAADETIARTVFQLMLWGFPLRKPNGVADVVSSLARSELQRTGHGQKNLGPDQIEKIFRAWVNQRSELEWNRQPWQRIQIDSLRRSGPQMSPLRDIAESLIRNKGEWPDSSVLPGAIWPADDPVLTKKAHAEYLRNRLRRFDPTKRGN